MGKINIFKILKDIIIAYGGWSVGAQISSRFTADGKPNFGVSVVSMLAAQGIAKLSEGKSQKDTNTPNSLNYRTDHVECIKTKQETHSKSMKL